MFPEDPFFPYRRRARGRLPEDPRDRREQAPSDLEQLVPRREAELRRREAIRRQEEARRQEIARRQEAERRDALRRRQEDARQAEGQRIPVERTTPARDEAADDRVVRLKADLENLRRHQDELVERARREERSRLLSDFVGVLDSIQRAIEANPDRESAWYRGNIAILKQMAGLLERHGLEPVGEEGEPFDPRRHEAVGTVNRGDLPDEVVAEVLEVGWRHAEGGLLRPAKVIVNRR